MKANRTVRWQRVAALGSLALVVLAAGCRRAPKPQAVETEEPAGQPVGAPPSVKVGGLPFGQSRGATATRGASGGARPGAPAAPGRPFPLMPEPARRVPVVKAGTASGLGDYLEGIELIEAGRWADAAAALGRAVEAGGDNASYHTARGVALTLAEDFPAALAELQRALRLRADDKDAKQWLACAFKMAGDPMRAAQHYSAGDPATSDYAAFLYLEMAQEYWQSRYQGRLTDKETRTSVVVQYPERRKFGEAGAWFARRAKATTSGQDLGAVLFARARQRYERGQFGPALADLEQVRAAYPDDRDVLFYHAGCKLALGDAVAARREFTRFLIFRTDCAAAYLGRAAASARLGDGRRVRADLETAARLDPAGAGRARGDIERSLQEAAGRLGRAEPSAALAAVEKGARDGTAWKTLVEQAADGIRAINARRLHDDETYQDNLREREDAVRASPADADRWAELGKFLYDQSEVFGERVEPRGPARKFRFQTPQVQQQELVRAEQVLDHALALNPDHLRALVARAALCFDQGRLADTEILLLHALKVGPDDPEMLYLFSELRKEGGRWRALRAAALRTPDISHTESREGDYIVTRTYRRDPSASDLRLADEYEQESNRLYEIARVHLEKALALSEGTALGWYYRGLVCKWARNFDGARAALCEAIKLDPHLLRARQELIYLLDRQGRRDDRLHAEADLINLVETSAGSMLKLAWERITRTAWDGAGEALAEARRLDPADARIPAYLGVMAEARGRLDEALAEYRAALAMEEARMELRGTTLEIGGTGLLDPEDVALGSALRQRLAMLLLRQKRPAEALPLFRANAALEGRLSRRDWTTGLFAGMLPDPAGDPARVPEADIVVAMLAWAHLGMGQALLALGRPQEAEPDFRAVRGYPTRLLATEKGRERLTEPEAWAVLALCRLMLARGEVEAASRLRTQWGRPWGLSPQAEQEHKQLVNDIEHARRFGR